MTARAWPYLDIPQHCTCGPARNSDGSENGLCAYCEMAEHEDEVNLTNDLHDLEGPYSVCPRAACRSTDIEVGPGETALCMTCGIRW